MNVAIIDNDLNTRTGHHYPNLAVMKLSAWHKNKGDNVTLASINEFKGLFKPQYDKVYCAKVFTDTPTPKEILNDENIIKGGTGFYYENSENLPNEIEHIKPDYNIYSDKIIKAFAQPQKAHYFTDFSIGFTTRGCIRKCSFCVNKNKSKVEIHSHPTEFMDESRPYLMLLDDNIMASKDYFYIVNELNKTKKPYVFKQGLDIRLTTKDKFKALIDGNYMPMRGGKNILFHFAFDNIADKSIITKKIIELNSLRSRKHYFTFYVLVGFDRNNKYDANFYLQDLKDMHERISILFDLNCQPYIMKHENYKNSPYSNVIDKAALYCNTPLMYGNYMDDFMKGRGVETNILDFHIKINTDLKRYKSILV